MANRERLAASIHDHVQALCTGPGGRPVGSQANEDATRLVAEGLAAHGFTVSRPRFDCIEWVPGEARLHVSPHTTGFTVHPSPHGPGCNVEGVLIGASTLDALHRVDAASKILLVHGELAREQLVPKHYPFYSVPGHQAIISELERQAPAAIIAATGKDPGSAGAVSPFPLVEDGDFAIPSCCLGIEDGHRLLRHEGTTVSLSIEAHRIPATACNVVATTGPNDGPRVVACAHVDTKHGTPGAIDNASGVATLLALAALFEGEKPAVTVEIVAFNGEDHYAAHGEVQYLASNAVTPEAVQLAINIDGAGAQGGNTAFSLHGCTGAVATRARAALGRRAGLVEGEPWMQGDHAIFASRGIPAVAITSDRLAWLTEHVVHGPADVPALVDARQLATVAVTVRDVIGTLAST